MPTLGLEDIGRDIEFVDSTSSFIGPVKTTWYEQPTNGISYIRFKFDLKSLPLKYRRFVPLFKELLPNIGTKNYTAGVFNDKVLSCSNGVEVSIDKFSDGTDKEQLLLQIGFLDRNIDEAFACLSELLAVPNFDEQDNLSDLIRMEAVNKAQSLGDKGLEYARSYANSGLKPFAKSYEALAADMFFC